MSKEEKRYKWINGDTWLDSDQVYDNKTGNKTQPVYVTDLLNEQDQKIADLEAKLAEKKKELFAKKVSFEALAGSAKKYQISFAVEQLEKVKEWANERYNGWKDNKNTNKLVTNGVCLALENVGYKIEEQINQLKEGK